MPRAAVGILTMRSRAAVRGALVAVVGAASSVLAAMMGMVSSVVGTVAAVVIPIRRGPAVSGVMRVPSVTMPVVPDTTIVVIRLVPNGGTVGPIVPANVVAIPAIRHPARCNEVVAADGSYIVATDPRVADPAPPPVPLHPNGASVRDGGTHLEPGCWGSGLDDHPRRLGFLDDDRRLALDRFDDDVVVGLGVRAVVDDRVLTECGFRNRAQEQQRQEREGNWDVSPELGAIDCFHRVLMFHDPPETRRRVRFIQTGQVTPGKRGLSPF